MHTWIEISRDAIHNNFRVLQGLAGNSIPMPVIKSNAYGHGLSEVFQCLQGVENLPWLAVNYLFEAEELRQLGFQGSILVVGPVFDEDFAKAFDAKATLFISHQQNLDYWLALKCQPEVHIKFDTGMGRQGFLPEQIQEVLSYIKPECKGKVRGFATHFANVEDVTVHEYAELQLSRFQHIKEVALRSGYSDRLFHSASSASTMLLEESRFNLCRIGISLYGFWPSSATKLSFLTENGSTVELKPAMVWKTKIAQIKNVKEGAFIGYGCTYRAPKDLKVAVLPVGYYEGYMRSLGEKNSYVLINGSRCTVIGRICMNMMMVDISHVSHINIGDEVVLLGKDRDEELPASKLAEWAGTIHYEMTTQILESIPRVIV